MSTTEAPSSDSQEAWLDDWQGEVVRRLGALELSETVINFVVEPERDETHIWRNPEGNIGVHLKRPLRDQGPAPITEKPYIKNQRPEPVIKKPHIVETRLHIRLSETGEVEKVHMLERLREDTANGRIIDKQRAVVANDRNQNVRWLDAPLGKLEDFLDETESSLEIDQAA